MLSSTDAVIYFRLIAPYCFLGNTPDTFSLHYRKDGPFCGLRFNCLALYWQINVRAKLLALLPNVNGKSTNTVNFHVSIHSQAMQAIFHVVSMKNIWTYKCRTNIVNSRPFV